MSIAEAGLVSTFLSSSMCEKNSRRLCLFSSSNSGCFQLPSNQRKYLLLKTERIIFLPWLYSSPVIWLVLRALVWGGNSMSEKRRLEEWLLNQVRNPERPIKQLVCFSYSPAVLKETEHVYNNSRSFEFIQGVKVLVYHRCPGEWRQTCEAASWTVHQQA